MDDLQPVMTVALAGLIGLTVAGYVILQMWRGWLEFRRLEITRIGQSSPPRSAGSRIDVADLRERVRKLEAIAEGIDL